MLANFMLSCVDLPYYHLEGEYIPEAGEFQSLWAVHWIIYP